jgi:hypothetical protein
MYMLVILNLSIGRPAPNAARLRKLRKECLFRHWLGLNGVCYTVPSGSSVLSAIIPAAKGIFCPTSHLVYKLAINKQGGAGNFKRLSEGCRGGGLVSKSPRLTPYIKEDLPNNITFSQQIHLAGENL